MKNTEKLLNRDCAKSGVYAKDLIRILHETFAVSERERVSRKLIAIKLNQPAGRIDQWTAPSCALSIPASSLLELIVNDTVLPDAARRKLLGLIATMAGFTVCDDTNEDAKPYPVQVTELSAALGGVGSKILAALTSASDNGKRLSAAEREEVVEAIDEVLKQAQELRTAVVKGGRR